MNNVTSNISIGGAVVLFTIAFLPVVAAAAPAPNAFLGGGNALTRATSGESQGLTNATSTSNLLEHLTFASSRGGRAEEVPPPNANTDSGDEGETTPPENANENAAGGNGGGQSGNGGNGGSSAGGGLVRAGSVVTNSKAVNVINTNIVRISSR